MRAWDFPKDPVTIACDSCKRRGQYSKLRFLELVGRDTRLPQALAILARDCPLVEKGGSMRQGRCKAYFPGLV